MRIVRYNYVNCSQCTEYLAEIDGIITEMTSECRNPMEVRILGGKFGQLGEKIPFVLGQALFMAVCAEEFAVIFELDSLNIREMIYMIDNEIVEFENSPFANV